MQYSAFPHAKINLGLIIKGRLPNGYHLLETLMYPIDNIKDTLIIEEKKTGESSMEIEGIAIQGSLSENLCMRAYNCLRQRQPALPPVHIYLKKGIPAGAGLGGGSSDAAFTLKGINTLFDLGFSLAELAEMAASLGADVPFFLYDTPLLASGIGTTVAAFEMDLSPYRIELITPPIHSATHLAYQKIDLATIDTTRSLAPLLHLPLRDWKSQLPNDLETPVFQLYPTLPAIKAELYAQGAIYAAMSGSGSAMFGIFHKD